MLNSTFDVVICHVISYVRVRVVHLPHFGLGP